MNDQNLQAYNSGEIVSWYDRLRHLMPAETLVFDRLMPPLESRNVLDIGIGGGRTTAWLMNKCRTYTGIDYSARFVTLAQKKFPAGDIRLMNAADLSAFKTGSFDFVNFSLNGLDYVHLSDREKVLSEISRVLKPGGTFFFSTHNMAHPCFYRSPWRDPSLNPVIRLKTFVKLMPAYFRHLSKKKHETLAKEYAVINDAAHSYKLLTFYTSPGFLREQLSRHGFAHLSLLSAKGMPEPDDRLDSWIFVTCEKQHRPG